MIRDHKSSFSSLRRAVAAALLAAPALASEFSVEAQSADVEMLSSGPSVSLAARLAARRSSLEKGSAGQQRSVRLEEPSEALAPAGGAGTPSNRAAPRGLVIHELTPSVTERPASGLEALRPSSQGYVPPGLPDISPILDGAAASSRPVSAAESPVVSESFDPTPVPRPSVSAPPRSASQLGIKQVCSPPPAAQLTHVSLLSEGWVCRRWCDLARSSHVAVGRGGRRDTRRRHQASDFGEFSSPQEEQEQAWRKAAYRLIGLAAPQLALTHASRFAAPDPSTMVDQAALKLQTLAGKKGAGSTSASLFLEDWAKYLVPKGDTSGVIFPVARSDVEEMASSFSTSG